MGNNIKFYAFYDSWGLIGSTVTLQIRIENVVRNILNVKLQQHVMRDNTAASEDGRGQ